MPANAPARQVGVLSDNWISLSWTNLVDSSQKPQYRAAHQGTPRRRLPWRCRFRVRRQPHESVVALLRALVIAETKRSDEISRELSRGIRLA